MYPPVTQAVYNRRGTGILCQTHPSEEGSGSKKVASEHIRSALAVKKETVLLKETWSQGPDSRRVGIPATREAAAARVHGKS